MQRIFQLYKKRDFSAYMSDTITFFRHYWRNFFSGYIIITGGMLLVLCVLFFFIFRDLFSAILGPSGMDVNLDFSHYFSDNLGMYILFVSIAVIVSIALSIFGLAYPIAYFRLVENNGEQDSFSTNEIFAQIKLLLPAIIRFFLMSLITFLPIFCVLMVVSVALSFVIIGIFILMILVPVFSVWFMQTFFVYLNNNEPFFAAMKMGWSIAFSKRFWHIVGSTITIYVIISVVQSLFALIIYMFFIIYMLTTGKLEQGGMLAVAVSVLYMISIVISYITTNVMMVNQGLIYYSFMEQEEHSQAFSEIESIGQNAQ